MILCVRAQPDATHVEGLPSLLQTVTVTSFLPDAGR